ncbi:MAG: serine protein kinase RIO [Candidatus Nanohaloarchaea archaeon]
MKTDKKPSLQKVTMDLENADRDFRERWKEESRRMFDSSEARKAFQNVFDHKTSQALLKLADNQVIKKMYGVIESGKESTVFLADTPEGERVIVKIYMTRAGSFREMKDYLRGDKRFRNVKDDRRSVVKEWTKKEFRNLKDAQNVVNCPEPVAVRENILVMDFIGENFSPYPKLKDVEVENPETGYENIIENIKQLWRQEKLVHGDLSEYNILVEEDGLTHWIDFSHGVHSTHPEAEHLLKRDIENIADFFRRKGVDTEVQKRYEAIISNEEAL